MQITIVQTEIERAIIDWIRAQGIQFDGAMPEMNIVASRGKEGITASFDVPLSIMAELGGALLEELPSKALPEEVLEAFKEPVPKKATVAPKKAAPVAMAPKKAPKPIVDNTPLVEEEEPVPEHTPLDATDPFADEMPLPSGSESLFGEAAADAEEAAENQEDIFGSEEETDDPELATADNLFAS